jgi:acetoacetyl-CoA synthetase
MPLPQPQITRYRHWLADQRQHPFDDSEALWQWSVTDLNSFWQSIWDYFEVESPAPPTRALAEDAAQGAAVWFPGTQVNYARQVFRHADAAHGADIPAILFRNERLHDAGRTLSLSWPELQREVASLAVALRGMGVRPGDRVAAYLPNAPQTVVAFLACASLGAVWSVCSPDMGASAVLDRFRQIAPKVLIACDGTTYGGRDHDRRPVITALLDGLPGVEHLVLWPCLDKDAEADEFARPGRRAYDLRPLLAGNPDFEPAWLPFDHPLWILWSGSGAQLPRPIVQGHGGVLLESLKLNVLHHDLGATVETGDRLHWTTSVGWITWNLQVGALLGGTTLCLYDGHPAGRRQAPDWGRLWRFVGETGVTFFGAGVAVLGHTVKAGLDLRRLTDLSALRAIGSAGAPLPTEHRDWFQAHLPTVDGASVWLTTLVGDADAGHARHCGLRPSRDVRGDRPCRCLGAAVEPWHDTRPARECTRPMPSMPLPWPTTMAAPTV